MKAIKRSLFVLVISVFFLGSCSLPFHAILAPIIFAVLSLVYFSKFNYTPPLQPAAIFVAFVIPMDFFIVAIHINKNFEIW